MSSVEIMVRINGETVVLQQSDIVSIKLKADDGASVLFPAALAARCIERGHRRVALDVTLDNLRRGRSADDGLLVTDAEPAQAAPT